MPCLDWRPEVFLGLTAAGCGANGTNSAFWQGLRPGPEQFFISGGGPAILATNFGTPTNPSADTSGTVTATAATPEPASLGMVMAGVAVIAWRRRRGQTMKKQSIPN